MSYIVSVVLPIGIAFVLFRDAGCHALERCVNTILDDVMLV